MTPPSSRLAVSRLLVQAGVAGVALVGLVFVLFPIFWMIGAAIRPIAEVLADPPIFIPHQVTLAYFANIAGNSDYRHYFLNSCILAAATLIVTVGLGLLGGYGFSRFHLRGGQAMLLGIMALWMLPPATLIIPYFRLAHDFHVYDSLLGLILADTAFTLPISIWLLKGYLDAIPIALEEAALIDGSTRLQALWKVVVPLTLPGIIGVGTFTFIAAWNEFLLAVVLTDTTASQTLSVGLANFFGQYVRDWNSIMALSTISTLPVMLLFVLLQRWVVQGLASGAGR